MVAKVITLTCLTNLCVGDGDVNYNIIDKEVEKDPVTGLPTIHDSGVKGALRSYLTKAGIPEDKITEWFGPEPKSKSAAKEGKIGFMQAWLLARPYRATDGNKPYYLVTTKESVAQYEYMCKEFGINPENKVEKSNQAISIEGIQISEGTCNTIEGTGDICVIPSNQEIKSIALPVVARNHLDNGISDNLWYEELVPHESIFWFIIRAEDSDRTLLDDFANAINGKVIQFGSGASIGRGLCKVRVR